MYKINQAVQIKGLSQNVRYTIVRIDNGKYYLAPPSGVEMLGPGYSADELIWYNEPDKVQSILDNYEE